MTKTNNNTTWMKEAECNGHAHLFFTETQLTLVNKARVICGKCLVKSACLSYALDNNEVGVWAGTTTNQRRRIRNNKMKLSDISLSVM